jgi:putative iron-only hydrogenase system regulator
MQSQHSNQENNTRICVVNIIAQDRSHSEKINAIISSYGEYVIGRMGIPYSKKEIFVLCLVMDAPVETVNALTGKLGSIENVTVKALFGKI